MELLNKCVCVYCSNVLQYFECLLRAGNAVAVIAVAVSIPIPPKTLETVAFYGCTDKTSV